MMMAKHITMEPISASLARVSLTAASVVQDIKQASPSVRFVIARDRQNGFAGLHVR